MPLVPSTGTHAPAPLPGPDPGRGPMPDPGEVVQDASLSAAAPASPIPIWNGRFTAPHAERLLWRAGFGPRQGQAAAMVKLGLAGAVQSLTRVSGPAPLDGPEPLDQEGRPLRPARGYDHDHAYWLDRMVRSRHQLVERHGADLPRLVRDLQRRGRLDAAHARADQRVPRQRPRQLQRPGARVTQDPAMLVFLDRRHNRKGAINENYARELMELFTLGADRGAYTETDVRELARALTRLATTTGATSSAPHNFRWDGRPLGRRATRPCSGRPGASTWEDAVRMVVEHPMHPSFFVAQAVVATSSRGPPDADEARRRSSALRRVRPPDPADARGDPVLAAALHGPAMVKPPVVFVAGLLRAHGQARSRSPCSGTAHRAAGQRLFYPPDVSGWDDDALARHEHDARPLGPRRRGARRPHHPIDDWATYPAETPPMAVDRARAFWSDPPLSARDLAALIAWAGALPAAQRRRAGPLRPAPERPAPSRS